jgi:hypothetical protein
VFLSGKIKIFLQRSQKGNISPFRIKSGTGYECEGTRRTQEHKNLRMWTKTGIMADKTKKRGCGMWTKKI